MDNKKSLANPKTRLHIRNATLSDVQAICDLTAKVYAESGMRGYSAGAITGQINIFPEGWPDWFFVPGSLTHFTA